MRGNFETATALTCFGMGLLAGLRPLGAAAVLAGDLLRRARMGHNRTRAFDRVTPAVRNTALAFGAAESAVDKAGLLPSADTPTGLIVRSVAGALVGGAEASSRGAEAPLGVGLGLLGAVSAALLGHAVRRSARRSIRMPNALIGFAEDAAALRLGRLATRWIERAYPTATAHSRRPPREIAKRGDILLFSGGKGFNWLIEEFGHTPYFHAAIYLGNDEIVEEQPKGVTKRTLCSDYGSHCIAVLPAPGGRETGLRALAWAESQIGDPFDPLDFYVIFLQHVFVGLHINYAPPGKYTCAEFVCAAWKQAGVALVPGVALSNIEPADLARLLPPQTSPAGWFDGCECV